MMTITAYDAWMASRAMADLPVEGDASDLSPGMRSLVERLLANEPSQRQAVLDGFTAAQDDPDRLVRAIVDARPTGPEPERGPGGGQEGATLADVYKLGGDQGWTWPGWIAGGALTSLAADPGVGKTLLAMTLARGLWYGWPWPDGHAASFPEGTKTLWVPGDHHFNQLIEVARAYKLPPESILLNGSVDEPTGRMYLDEPEAIEALAHRVASDRPGLVIIDTVGMTTDRNLGRSEEAHQYFEPLMRIAGKTRTSFLLLTHLSKESQALGRRIVSASRVVWKLTQPDPEGQPDRRKLWADKSYSLKPPALGMTIAAEGCTFDDKPPTEAPKDTPGRTPARTAVRREACKRWLVERLTPLPVRLKDLRSEVEQAGFSSAYLYAVFKELDIEEYLVDGRKWWKLPTPP